MEINVGAKIKTPFESRWLTVSKQIYQRLIREAEIFVFFFQYKAVLTIWFLFFI